MRATDGIAKLACRCNPISPDCQMRPITKPSANAAKIAKPITIGAVIGYALEASRARITQTPPPSSNQSDQPAAV
jgi:hypothetical protein